METIYKYTVEVDDAVFVRMPRGAQVLCVQMQNGVPCIWTLVNTANEKVDRKFAWRGTGHDCESIVDDDGIYVGTIQEQGLVFHLFDLYE